MRIIIIVLAIGLQALLSAWFVSKYFVAIDRLSRGKGLSWRAAEWILFAIFAMTVIPLGLFFPLWFESRLPGEAAAETGRLVLAIVGCASLAVSVGFGWHHWRRSKHHFPAGDA
jgi:hypothetical protein